MKENSARCARGLQELRGKLNVWHSQSAGLHTERERVSRALAVMDERQLSLAAQKRSAESDLARLEEEQKSRQDRLAELEEERSSPAGGVERGGRTRGTGSRRCRESARPSAGSWKPGFVRPGGRCWTPKPGRFR